MAVFSDCSVASSEHEINSEKFGRCVVVVQLRVEKQWWWGCVSEGSKRSKDGAEVVAFQGVQFAESFQQLQLVLKEDIS